MTATVVLAAVKDILIGVAAATTAIVAVVGLKNWNRELHGKTAFEVARNLMKSTYKVRDEIQYSRAPFVDAREFPSDYPGQSTATAEQEAQAWNYVYNNRWLPVREAVQEFEANVLEGEALWGQELRKRADKLRDCAKSLQVAMEAVVNNKANRGEDFEGDKDFGNKMRQIVHASRSDKNNEMSREIQNAVTSIEDYVRPHLQRKNKKLKG